MCLAGAGPADFDGTYIYSGVHRIDDKDIHVMAYQNTVRNNMWDGKPNCMILFVPAVVLSKDHFLETDKCPNILKDMRAAEFAGSRGGSRGSLSLGIEHFNYGIYEVLVTQNPDEVQKAITELVSPEKQAVVTDEVIQFAKDQAQGMWMIVACFNTEEAMEATPFMFWYETQVPEFMWASAVDEHSGEAPDLESYVDVNHFLMFYHYAMHPTLGDDVEYTDDIPEHIKPYLPPRVGMKTVKGRMPNGDFAWEVADVTKGYFLKNPVRVLPNILMNS